jgi:hypothetical protein
MKLFFRSMMALARGGVVFALLMPPKMALADASILPATWVAFVRDGSSDSPRLACASDAARPLPLKPMRQLIDEEDILQVLDGPVADAKLMTAIAAPEPSAAAMAGIAFACICCTRTTFLRRRRQS